LEIPGHRVIDSLLSQKPFLPQIILEFPVSNVNGFTVLRRGSKPDIENGIKGVTFSTTKSLFEFGSIDSFVKSKQIFDRKMKLLVSLVTYKYFYNFKLCTEVLIFLLISLFLNGFRINFSTE